MNQPLNIPRWLRVAGIGLGLVAVAVVCVFLITQNPTSPNSTILETSKPSTATPSSLPITEPAVAAVEAPSPLPHLDFPPGSIEEACDFNELPTYWITGKGLQSNFWQELDTAFETDECQTALETHMSASNPHQFLSNVPYLASMAEFLVLDEPFTFERIFADPESDLLRVQEALSNPECLLTGDETNWELKETCHADALLNYAFVNLFCYGGGVKNRDQPVYWPETNPTPEQDRLMWKQDLEDQWVEEKCEELSPTLELTSKHHPQLYALVTSLKQPNTKFKRSQELLVELAARLGDDAAGLTQAVSGHIVDWGFFGDGYKYGRFSGLVRNPGWKAFTFKEELSTDRFLHTLYILTIFNTPKSDPRGEIGFDWEFVARHLCEPPYFVQNYSTVNSVEKVEHSSCKEVVHEIRQRNLNIRPLLDTLDKFEQVALELGVYE